jgi:hypothetical protein
MDIGGTLKGSARRLTRTTKKDIQEPSVWKLILQRWSIAVDDFVRT